MSDWFRALQLFERWIALSIGQISIQWIAQLVFLILIRWIVIYLVDSTISSLWTTRNRTLINLVTYSKQNYSATHRRSRIAMLDPCAYRFNKIREVCFIMLVWHDGGTRMSPPTLQQLKYWQVFVCLVLEEVSKQMRGNLSFCPNSHQLVSSDIDEECKLTYCFRNYYMISCKTGTKCL